MKLKVPSEVPPERPNPCPTLPLETWELMELAALGCPDEPLRLFRKTLIGRGKPLTARQADAAIAGARAATATGPLINRTNKRQIVPETVPDSLYRLYWYVRTQLPVVFARPQGYEYSEEELEIIEVARELEDEVIFLEWDDAAVDRVAGPG